MAGSEDQGFKTYRGLGSCAGAFILLATIGGLANCGEQGTATLAVEDSHGDYEAVESVRNAIQGNPDARTVAAMETLASALSDQQRAYLEFLDWSGVTRESAEKDPGISAALLALHNHGTNGAKSAGTNDFPGTRLSAYPQLTGNLYTDVAAVMQACWNGTAKCFGLPCMAAVIQAHIDTYGPIGSPAPNPVPVDNGEWTCSLAFGADAAAPSCDFKGFCRNPVFEGGGKWHCDDDGWNQGASPTCPTAPEGGAAGSSSGCGNVWFQAYLGRNAYVTDTRYCVKCADSCTFSNATMDGVATSCFFPYADNLPPIDPSNWDQGLADKQKKIDAKAKECCEQVGGTYMLNDFGWQNVGKPCTP